MSNRDIKTFVVYKDAAETLEDLTDLQIAKLVRSIFKFINEDEEPDFSDDPFLKFAFRNFKRDFERNEQKWIDEKEKRSLAGKKSGESRRRKTLTQSDNEQCSTVLKSVEHCSTVFNNVQMCSTNRTINRDTNSNKNKNKNSSSSNMLFNQVEQCSAAAANISFSPSSTKKDNQDVLSIKALYLSNYDSLYNQGVLSLDSSRMDTSEMYTLINEAINTYGADNVKLALERAYSDTWSINHGYALKVILSDGCMRVLLNTNEFKNNDFGKLPEGRLML